MQRDLFAQRCAMLADRQKKERQLTSKRLALRLFKGCQSIRGF